MKKLKLILLILITFSINATAQDFHFSQSYSAPLTTNPANTGLSNADIRAYTLYRMQWFTVTRPYKTYSVAVDAPIFRNKMQGDDFFAAGLNFNNDNDGTVRLKTNSYNGSVSYTKYLGGRQKNFISIGYQFGYNIKSAGYGSLTWDSQWDGTNYNAGVGVNESGGGARAYFDMGAGLVWNFTTDRLFKSALGFSLHHFTVPDVSIAGGGNRLLPKLGVQWNGQFKLKSTSNATYQPSVMAALQGTSLLINAGVNVKYVLEEHSRYTNFQMDKAFSMGLFYRFRDAAFVTLRYDYDAFAFSLAYDINISGLIPATKSVGGFEFMLQYRGIFGNNKNSKRSSSRFL